MREQRPPIALGPGLAGAILVIVVAWALAAVLMLTGTLTNAREINRRVKLVNAQVGPIYKNLAFVKLAQRTGRISAKIRLAAQNLSTELNQVIASAGDIDTKVASILTKARSINGTVGSINGNVVAINGNAHAINGTVHSINSNVQSISASVASIGGRVASIHSRVDTVAGAVGPVGAHDKSINADVTLIRARLGTTLTTAQSIRGGVVGINNHADAVIALAQALKGDFDNVISTVGTAINTATILGHANSIDCSALINLLGPTQSCNK